jgi:hypothetical protein
MKLLKLFAVILGISPVAANANWSYWEDYDDGARFYVRFAGGVAFGGALDMNNDMVGITTPELAAGYAEDTANPGFADLTKPTGEILTLDEYKKCVDEKNCASEAYASIGKLEFGKSPIKDSFSVATWTTNLGAGFVLPNSHFRTEVSWDHISETKYSSSKLISDTVETTGYIGNAMMVDVDLGSVTSKVSTDIVSLMFYYDMYDGLVKPAKTLIPYIGAGLGYANSTVNMSYIDSGALRDTGLFCDFFSDGACGTTSLATYQSETNNGGLAFGLAGGFSYGLSNIAFLDIGAKLMYADKIIWTLSNEGNSAATSTVQQDIFSTSGTFYIMGTVGFRFEF